MTLTRNERDRFTAATPDDIAYGEGACLETPPQVFELLNRRFKFDVDLTANEQNHLLPHWFGPGSPWPDALTHVWSYSAEAKQAMGYGKEPTSGFSNPPYGPFIPKILTKAVAERDRGFTSVFLLPMRASGWFRDLVLPYYSELWYCSSRLTFNYKGRPRLNPKTGKADPALFDSIIVVYAAHTTNVSARGQFGLFPPPQRPNVWDVKTGELRY